MKLNTIHSIEIPTVIYLKPQCLFDGDLTALTISHKKLYAVMYVQPVKNDKDGTVQDQLFIFATNPLGRKHINSESGIKELIDFAPILYDAQKHVIGKIFKLGLCKCQCWNDKDKLRNYLDKHNHQDYKVVEICVDDFDSLST